MGETEKTKSEHDQTMVLCRDFNEIIGQDEKFGGGGGALRSDNQMQLFKEVIDGCSFMDMGFIGSKYTWSKHFDNGVSIWERLDRGLANKNWFLKFLRAKVHHISCNTSDHLPLFFSLLGLEIPVRRKIFRFKEMWLSDSRCGETVEAAWRHVEGPNSDNIILQKVAKYEKDLT